MAIADSVDDAIVGTDLRGVMIAWNKGAEAMFGYAAAEIIGRPVVIIIPLGRIDEEASIVGQVRRGEKLAHFETGRACKDGRIIPVSLTIAPVGSTEGTIVNA